MLKTLTGAANVNERLSQVMRERLNARQPIQSESERSGDVPPWLNRKRQPSTGSGLLGFQT
eukprot:2624306-Prymnesium_polylepis.1